MQIKDVQHLANLARIDITDSEAEGLLGDLEAIISYVDQVTEVMVKDGEIATPEHHNVFREDTVTTERGQYTDALLAAAPDIQDGFVKVRKIL